MLRSLLADARRVARVVHDAVPAFPRAHARGGAGDVLRRQHLRADAREQEGVEPLADHGLAEPLGLLKGAHGCGQVRNDAAHPALQLLDDLCEWVKHVDVELHEPQVAEGPEVEVVHFHELPRSLPALQALDLHNPLGVPDRQLRARELGGPLRRGGVQDLPQGDGAGLLRGEEGDLRPQELRQAVLGDLHRGRRVPADAAAHGARRAAGAGTTRACGPEGRGGALWWQRQSGHRCRRSRRQSGTQQAGRIALELPPHGPKAGGRAATPLRQRAACTST
mmetsp:Transcript_39429/g.125339  ORF Transcript_39429/g.125339 Transcript_39429/m.125339 type:complete len:279 (+) Transcript_39429:663-1499(+)